MNKLNSVGIAPAKILLPKKNYEKWAVVACDQYTAQREYWENVDEYVADAPSTLRLILPEVYLEDDDVAQKQAKINETMQKYLQEEVFDDFEGIIYLERQVEVGTRKGLVVCLDLECYDYHKGSTSMIRATEDTIEDRLPPRVEIRMKAPLELPHIMVLIDDEDNIVMDSIKEYTSESALYDFNLMEGGGNIKGYAVDVAAYDVLAENLEKLKEKNNGFLYAMGDGNHSLATAKKCWEEISKELTNDEKENHLARYALVEIVNLHDEALEFESIHRLVMNTSENALEEIAKTIGFGEDPLPYYKSGGQGMLLIETEDSLCVAAVQKGLDKYIEMNPQVKIDYIHGDKVAEKLSRGEGNISFIMPIFDKKALFRTVMNDGALPRKSFSMGHAHEKRYYLEARKINQE